MSVHAIDVLGKKDDVWVTSQRVERLKATVGYAGIKKAHQKTL